MFVSQIIDEASEILATTDQNKVFRKLTQALQVLMESGHYFHTNAEVDVCTGWDGQTITLPRGIEVPLAVNVDGSPSYFRGRLFQYHVNKGGMYSPVTWAWDDRGFVATLMDIKLPSQLIAVAEHQSDVGKTLRILGNDNNNRPLRSTAADGTPVDGLIIPIHSKNDFPFGTIQPDGVTISTRSATITPINELQSATAHNFQSGQLVKFTSNSGTIPTGLSAGQNYYVGVVNSLVVQLYQNALDAQNANNPIPFSSIVGSTTNGLQLTDARTTQLLTAINLQAVPPISITSPNEVTFSLGSATALPSPLVDSQVYFAQSLDTSNLQIYGSLADANAGTNPVLLTGNSIGDQQLFNVDIRKAMSPVTKLTFSVAGYFSTGDIVQAYTAGGTLPTPLIQGQNYYVYAIDSFNITLHTNSADSSTGSNPIIFTTAGTGQNSIVKLIPASVNVGVTNNVAYTPSAFSLQTPTGTGASALAVAVGAVTAVSVTSAGSGYNSAPTINFTSPPSPPTGSNQQTRVAQGYAVMAGTGSSQSVASIVITDGGLGYTTTPAITFSGGSPTTTASATATLTKSFISYFNILSGGSNYTTAPQVTITGGGGTGATATASVANGQVTAINIVTQGTGYTSNPSVTITPSTGVFVQFASTGTLPSPLLAGTAYRAEAPLSTTNGTFTIKDASFNPITITDNGSGQFYIQLSRTFAVTFNNEWSGDFAGNTNGDQLYFSSDYLFPATNSSLGYGYITKINNNLAKFFKTQVEANVIPTLPVPTGSVVINNGGYGYSSSPSVTPSGGGGTGATFSASVTGGVTSYVISKSGAGYLTPPAVVFSGGGGTNATAVTTIAGGIVTSIQIQSAGSGYTSNPTLTLGSQWSGSTTGVTYVSGQAVTLNQQFTATSGNLYTVTTAGTLSSTSPTDTTGNAVANGTAYVAYAGSGATASVNVTNVISGISVTAGGSNYATMPILTITDSTGVGATATITDNAIQVTGIGTGQAYYAVREQAYAQAYIPADNSTNQASLLVPSSTQYLTNGQSVTFTTTGTLPLPLVAETSYTINLYGDYIYLTSEGNPVQFKVESVPTLANGTMTMNNAVNFTAIGSTTLSVPNSIYETGAQVMVRANPNDSLPNPLSPEATSTTTSFIDAFVNGGIVNLYNANVYYASFVDDSTISLYATQQQALAGGTNGLVTYLSTGNTLNSSFEIDSVLAPTLVKSVAHVEKPQTAGYVSLYAYDYGRHNDTTLIGQYHPAEVNPQYRRIRIGQSCAWARILYRVSRPDITSVYDYIPLENTRAILCALHAVDLEDKDFFEQAQKYMALAVGYLHSQNESMEGHAMMPPQINNITYGDGTDPVIDSDFYGSW